MHKNTKDITGQRFERLVVMGLEGKARGGQLTWKCLCDCGSEVIVLGSNLRSGHTRSCGLHRRTGKDHHNYKGGLGIEAATGRCSVRCRDGSEVYFAEIVMEGFLGQELNPEFVVHHRNNDPSKDELSNLALFSNQSAHRSFHAINRIRDVLGRFTKEVNH